MSRSGWGRKPLGLNPKILPNVPVEIDWSHPLTRGLVGCYIAGNPKDLTGNGPALLSDGPGSYIQSSTGTAAVDIGAASTTDGGPPVSAWMAAANVSMFVQIETYLPGAGFSNGTYGPTDPTHAYSVYYNLYLGGYGGVNWNVNNGASYTGNSQLSIGFSAAPFNATCPLVTTMMGTYATSRTQKVYVGGKIIGSQAAATVAPLYNPANNVWATNFGLGGAEQSSSIEAWFNVEKTAAETIWLDAEPFAFLRPITRRQFYYVSSSTGPVVEAQPVVQVSLYNNITDANFLRADSILTNTIAASFSTGATGATLLEVDLLLER